jgi:hypothetical protein
LTQTANVPLSDQVAFTIDSAPTTAVSIKFRIPYWIAAGQPVTVNLNGQCINAKESGGYIALSRVWTTGDKIELKFPSDVQVARLQDNKNSVAFTYGPVVLSAGLGTQSMVSTGYLASKQATLPSGVTIRDTIKVNSDTTIEDWIKNVKSNLIQTAGKLEFKLKNTDADSDLTFTPQYQRYADRYGIYFKLLGTQGASSTAGGTTSVNIATCAVSASGGAGATGGTSSSGATSSTEPSSGGEPNNGGATGSVNQAAGGNATATSVKTASYASGGAAANTNNASGSGALDSAAGASAVNSGDSESSGCSCGLVPSWTERGTSVLLLSLGLSLGLRRRRRNVNARWFS